MQIPGLLALAGAHESRPIKELGRGLDSCGCWLL
jgi:hypothetical protein